MAMHEFDLLIAGAGPAGCTLALHMAHAGYRVGVVERDRFPRHKICGDALSGKVINILKRIPGGVYEDFLSDVEKLPARGIRFTAPNLHSLDLPFPAGTDPSSVAPGYVCRRDLFDGFLFSRIKAHPNIRVFEGEEILRVHAGEHSAGAESTSHQYKAAVMAGADGVHSMIRRSLSPVRDESRHICLGIRGYYQDVSGLQRDGFIELLFLRELLPGYFWIFPSAGGGVNAGIGMMQEEVRRRRLNMSRLFSDLISQHPLLAPRFRQATLTGRLEAHALPLGSLTMKRSGNRFLLLGDAGFLVSPFSGEGIGNAMASGEIAAQILHTAFCSRDFSSAALESYDARIARRFSGEFRTMSVMQRLAAYPRLFNLVVDKTNSNSRLREVLTSMYANDKARERLTRPGFYIGLLFK